VAPASNCCGLAAFLARQCEGKCRGGVGKERGWYGVVGGGGAERVGEVGEVVQLGYGEVGGG
jgi:hypothetical protein